MSDFDVFYVFRHGDPLLVGVFLILLVMSIATWTIAAGKFFTLLGVRRQNRRSLAAFEKSQSARRFRDVAGDCSGPLASIAQDGYHAFDHYRGVRDGSDKAEQQLDDHVVRMIRQSMDRENLRMQAGNTILASVGSLAPFVGLLGTVWGIHAALIDISTEASVSMDLVAGPLGEALIATAAGLAAAIPAVAFFNVFNRAQRLQHQTLEAFAHDLHALLMHSGLQPGQARRADTARDPAQAGTSDGAGLPQGV
ncbi:MULTISPECIES: MotA/TolQ/ExbB proton channel family protein [unclassified Thioalkalivibrio]|uniref:MotA/TolQ/ExbB proton channel family protein n=1 Tax=unclassified Thioalkalivibrio TaxID=2621013 RepID=UPI000368FDDE|nr:MULTISPECIES: MotA/TolQ/ExbB proton channel family protein [unclassified Thioalkalivibrio]